MSDRSILAFAGQDQGYAEPLTGAGWSVPEYHLMPPEPVFADLKPAPATVHTLWTVSAREAVARFSQAQRAAEAAGVAPTEAYAVVLAGEPVEYADLCLLQAADLCLIEVPASMKNAPAADIWQHLQAEFKAIEQYSDYARHTGVAEPGFAVPNPYGDEMSAETAARLSDEVKASFAHTDASR